MITRLEQDPGKRKLQFESNFDTFMNLVKNDVSGNYYGLDANNLSEIKCDHEQELINEFDRFRSYLEKAKADGSFFAIAYNSKYGSLDPPCEFLVGYTSTDCMQPAKAPAFKLMQNKALCCASASVQPSTRLVDCDNTEHISCIKACKPISCGDVVICEKPKVMSNRPNCKCAGKTLLCCHYCLKPLPEKNTTWNGCKKCRVVMICSNAVCNAKLYNCHVYECEGVSRHFWGEKLQSPAYLGMKMMMFGADMDFNIDKPEIAPNKVQPFNHYWCCNYGAFYGLKTNMNRINPFEYTEIMKEVLKTMCYLAENTDYLETVEIPVSLNKYQKFIFLGGLVYRHSLQVLFNSVYMMHPDLVLNNSIEVVDKITKGICPVIAHLNHSCNPNAALSFYNDTIVVRAIRNIKEGEEICIAYREIAREGSVQLRNLVSSREFKFKCDCETCLLQLAYGDRVLKCGYCDDGQVRILDNDDRILQFFLLQLGSSNIENAKNVIDYVENHLKMRDNSNTENIETEKSGKNLSRASGAIKKKLSWKQRKRAKEQNPSLDKENSQNISSQLWDKLSDAYGKFDKNDVNNLILDIISKKNQRFQNILNHDKHPVSTKEGEFLNVDDFDHLYGTFRVIESLNMVPPPELNTTSESGHLKKILERTSDGGREVMVYIVEKPDRQIKRPYPVQGLCGLCFTAQNVDDKIKILDVIDTLWDMRENKDDRLKESVLAEALYGLCDSVLHPDCAEMNEATLAFYETRKTQCFSEITLDLLVRLNDATIRRFGRYYYTSLCSYLTTQFYTIYSIGFDDPGKINYNIYNKLKDLTSRHKHTLLSFKMYAPGAKLDILMRKIEQFERDVLKKFKKKLNKR